MVGREKELAYALFSGIVQWCSTGWIWLVEVNFAAILSFLRRHNILPFALTSVFPDVHLCLLVYLACLAHVLLLVSLGSTIYSVAPSLFCSWRQDSDDSRSQ